MWKCPECGMINMGDICPACGARKDKFYKAYKPSFSTLRFVVLTVAVLLLLFAAARIAFAIIDDKQREKAERLNREYSYENYLNETAERQAEISAAE